MLIVLLVIIGLSILILGHEAGHFLVAKLFGLKIDEFGFGFPPRIFARKKGETEYSINALPFGGFVRIAGENDPSFFNKEEGEAIFKEKEKERLFFAQPARKRALIIAAGVAVNFIIGWLLLSFIFMVGTPSALVISGIQKDSPASQIGIVEGDVIKNFIKANEFIEFINKHRGQEVQITIIRGGKEFSFLVTPRAQTEEGEGALGVYLAEAGMPRHGLFQSLFEGIKTSFQIAWLTLVSFYELIKNLFFKASLLKGVVGPVGIFFVAQQTGHIGLIYLLQLIGLISINLTVINLIPFPALDGGRLFMILIEKIKGSPVSRKVEAWANGLGFAFLIVLIALITVRDIGLWF